MEPFIGQIQPLAFNFAPRGWAKCDGQLLSIANNTALFSLLGTTYGGDGRTTFGLPDLRGRNAVHTGQGPGLTSRPIGQRTGVESVALTTPTMPAHTHVADLRAASAATTQSKPEGNLLSQAPIYHAPPSGESMSSESIDVASAGGGQAHANMAPFLVINWCIALTGVFPSRN